MVRDARYQSDQKSLVPQLDCDPVWAALSGTEAACLQLLEAHESNVKDCGRAWTEAYLHKGVRKACSVLLLGLLFASYYYVAQNLGAWSGPKPQRVRACSKLSHQQLFPDRDLTPQCI